MVDFENDLEGHIPVQWRVTTTPPPPSPSLPRFLPLSLPPCDTTPTQLALPCNNRLVRSVLGFRHFGVRANASIVVVVVVAVDARDLTAVVQLRLPLRGLI